MTTKAPDRLYFFEDNFSEGFELEELKDYLESDLENEDFAMVYEYQLVGKKKVVKVESLEFSDEKPKSKAKK